MQDVQSINSGGKVLLRRINHHPPPQQVATFNNYLNQQPLSYPHLQPPQPQQAAALKCPRCDSLNTKFCYYNNYNLSQPRHFCKNCRRYWTKGGVLRNVPVGGGCRKSKKSSKSKSPPSSHTTSPTPTATTNASISSTGGNNYVSQTRDLGLSSSHSSSESCSNATLFQIPDMDNLETNTLFSDDIENLMRIDNNTNNNNNNNNDNNNNIHDNNSSSNNNNSTVSRAVTAEAVSFTEYLRNQEWEMGKIICGVQQDKIDRSRAVDLVDVDQTVRIEDFLQNRGGISALDWNPTADNNQGLFDVGDDSTVDHHDYWGQTTSAVDHHHDTQWSDSTTGHLPLFLP